MHSILKRVDRAIQAQSERSDAYFAGKQSRSLANFTGPE